MRTKDQIALEEVYNSIILEKKQNKKKKPCCDECKHKKKNTCCMDNKIEELDESFFGDVSFGPQFIEAMMFWVVGLGSAAAAAGAAVGGSNLLRVIAKYKEKNNLITLLSNPEIKPLYDELKDLYKKYDETKDMKINFEHQKKSNEIKQKIAELIGIEAHGEDASKYHMAVKKALQEDNKDVK